MRRLLVPLIVVFLLLGLLAESAAADAPKERIEEASLTFNAGESSTLVIPCRTGYKAVTAVIVRTDPGISVFYGFEDTSPTGGSQWIFRVKNRGNRAGVVRAKVRCVKVFEPPQSDIDVLSRILTRRERLDPGELERLIASCPRGDAPLGWGFSESAPGGPANDPPQPGAATRLFQVQPSSGQFTFGVEGSGIAPVDVRFRAICIDRHLQTRQCDAEYEVIRRSFSFNLGAGDRENRNLRCGRGTVPGAPGWSLPATDPFFAGLFDIRVGENKVGFINQGEATRRVAASQLCLEPGGQTPLS